MAVSDDSARRTNASAARNSCFEKPWLLSATASGGPEIVVTAYSTPTPPPRASAAARSARTGLRRPAACSRIGGSRIAYVASFSHPGWTYDRISVPITMPGIRPTTTSCTRGRTSGSAARFTHSTHAFSTTSTRTSAGFRTRLVRNSSASGTVIDENPYPSAPLTRAAPSVMTTIATACGMDASNRATAPASSVVSSSPQCTQSIERQLAGMRHGEIGGAQIVAFGQPVRDRDRFHAGRARGRDAGTGVLDRDRTRRIDAEPPRGFEVDVGRRLPVRHLVAGHDRVEQRPDAEALDGADDPPRRRGRSDG